MRIAFNSALRLARRSLDRRFDRARNLTEMLAAPPSGWVRALREALGMTTTQLAERMGVTKNAIPQIEKSEQDGTVRLDTLRRVAEALDCTLVYALVPNSPLEQKVENQLRARVQEMLGEVGHTMGLEDQAVTNHAELEAQIGDVLRDFDTQRVWDLTPDERDRAVKMRARPARRRTPRRPGSDA